MVKHHHNFKVLQHLSCLHNVLGKSEWSHNGHALAAPRRPLSKPAAAMALSSRMPITIAATKANTWGCSVDTATSAGPGQMPPTPQPTPNTAAPAQGRSRDKRDV